MTRSRSYSPTAAAEEERASVKSKSRSHSPDAAEQQQDDIALEADDGNDTDSALSIPAPSLESLRSSVLEHQMENGRTYHSMSSGKYAFPNDNGEIERLEIQYNLWLLTLNGEPGLCPKLSTAKRVLDAGTGPGLWAINYADEHPDAEVIGVDLSPIQPSLVPPNCTFELDDLEKDWTWSKPFDFIMSRAMTGCFSDYDAYIQKAYDALEPGGYLELQDLHTPFGCDDGTLTEDTPTYRFGSVAIESSQALGRPLDVSPMHKDRMRKAGFVDIVERQFKWPIGTWPKDKYYKEIGYWCHANLDFGLEGLMMALLTRGLGWTKEEVMVFCADVRRGLKDPRVHAYIPIYVVYGRKPEAGSVPAPEVAAE